MTNSHHPKGIILFAHGSRDPLWHKPMQAIANQIATQSPQTPVACAYLELSAPDLATAVETMMGTGVRTINIIPMFLGVGRHAREDLPVLVSQLQEQYPQVHFALNPAVGEELRLIHLLAQIAIDSL